MVPAPQQHAHCVHRSAGC